MRMRRKHNISARMEKCAPLLITSPYEYKDRWLSSFGCSKLILEIGCGKGGFINTMAKNNPDTFFIALEKSDNVIITALESATNSNMQNIRYINAPAEMLCDIFGQSEVSVIYINFCDPWPANRHRKRRLVSSGFLHIYRNILKTGGQIHFKTDSGELYDFALREFESCSFSLQSSTGNFHEHYAGGEMTEYEKRFYEQGIPVFYCRAVKE